MSVRLGDIEAFLIDLDGVMFRGRQPIPGASELVQLLHTRRLPFLFITNNSTRTPEQVADKLLGMGVRIGPDQILTSAEVAAEDLARTAPPELRVFMLGSVGLREALLGHGIELTEEYARATHVVAGLDPEVTYERLAQACLAVGRGARFVATNNDLSFPSERGLEPGAGALLAVIEATTGIQPHVYGKPARPMFLEALRRLRTTAPVTAIIGDRYDTDIRGGLHAGLVTLAVTTGADSDDDLRRQEPPPSRIFPSVLEIFEELRQVG